MVFLSFRGLLLLVSVSALDRKCYLHLFEGCNYTREMLEINEQDGEMYSGLPYLSFKIVGDGCVATFTTSQGPKMATQSHSCDEAPWLQDFTGYLSVEPGVMASFCRGDHDCMADERCVNLMGEHMMSNCTDGNCLCATRSGETCDNPGWTKECTIYELEKSECGNAVLPHVKGKCSQCNVVIPPWANWNTCDEYCGAQGLSCMGSRRMPGEDCDMQISNHACLGDDNQCRTSAPGSPECMDGYTAINVRPGDYTVTWDCARIGGEESYCAMPFDGAHMACECFALNTGGIGKRWRAPRDGAKAQFCSERLGEIETCLAGNPEGLEQAAAIRKRIMRDLRGPQQCVEIPNEIFAEYKVVGCR
jgi:hypothetical protein